MSLTKIANRETLTRADVVTAARELQELEKQAADADAYGRELAHQYVNELVKEAEEAEKNPEAEDKKDKAEGKKETKAEEKKEEMAEKTSSVNEIAAAIAILKKHGVVTE